MSNGVTRYDICLKQAGIYRLVVDIQGGPDNITGFTGAMQIRPTKASEEVLAEMDPDWFTADDVNRQLVLEIPDEATTDYDWNGQAVYDMFLVSADGTDQWPVIEGKVRLDKAVTRE